MSEKVMCKVCSVVVKHYVACSVCGNNYQANRVKLVPGLFVDDVGNMYVSSNAAAKSEAFGTGTDNVKTEKGMDIKDPKIDCTRDNVDKMKSSKKIVCGSIATAPTILPNTDHTDHTDYSQETTYLRAQVHTLDKMVSHLETRIGDLNEINRQLKTQITPNLSESSTKGRSHEPFITGIIKVHSKEQTSKAKGDTKFHTSQRNNEEHKEHKQHKEHKEHKEPNEEHKGHKQHKEPYEEHKGHKQHKEPKEEKHAEKERRKNKELSKTKQPAKTKQSPAKKTTEGKKMSYKTSKTSKYPHLQYPGIVLLILGLFLLFLWPHLYRHIIDKNLRLRPNSNFYHMWHKTQDPPLLLEIYFHNWTNPDDINTESIKPKFQEVGPFVFRQQEQKVNIVWNANNTVSYRRKKTWQFDEASSCCSLSTNLTTVDAVLLTIAQLCKYNTDLLKVLLPIVMTQFSEKVHITKSAREMLFEGYSIDHLGIAVENLNIRTSDKMGFFYGKNDSSTRDGLLNVDISAENHGEMRRWNTWTQTPYFEGICGQVHGSASEIYPPRLNRYRTSFFSTDMCRNVPLDYEQDESVHGLTGYKYIAMDSMLDNGTLYPENKCFCNGECTAYGVVNISSCKLGSPSFVSMPHFLHADPFYLDKVEGLSPDMEKHQYYIILEPNSGLPLEVAARIQINMFLQPDKNIPVMKNVQLVMFPIIWFQVKVTASKHTVKKLKFLFSLPTIFKGLALSAIILGLVLLALTLFVKRKAKSKPIAKESVPLQPKDHF